MSDKELQAVSGEDLEMFKLLVANFYKRPLEESYALPRADIRRRLLRRSTNPTYKSMLVEEADDLVTRVVIRYGKVYGNIRRAGRVIESFEAMLEDRTKLVYYEALRRYSKHVTDIPIDDPNSPEPPSPVIPIYIQLEDGEERKRLNRCLLKCLRELPEHARSILIEYCDTDKYVPRERSQMRLRLALRESNIPADGATP